MYSAYEQHVKWVEYCKMIQALELGIPTQQTGLDLPESDDVRINDMAPVMRAAGNVIELASMNFSFPRRAQRAGRSSTIGRRRVASTKAIGVAEAQQIRLARAMKQGRPPRRFPGPVESFSLVIPLLAFAIRRAGRAAIAMEARGLAPGAPRTITTAPRFHRRDVAFVAVALAMLALCISWSIRADA